MSLPTWEDFDSMRLGGESAVWMQRTVRLLVPKAALGQGVPTLLASAFTVDGLTSGLVGEPVECECGKVAVRYGNTYVWGRDCYGKRDDTHRVPGQYCPHCDGGEDIG